MLSSTYREGNRERKKGVKIKPVRASYHKIAVFSLKNKMSRTAEEHCRAKVGGDPTIGGKRSD